MTDESRRAIWRCALCGHVEPRSADRLAPAKRLESNRPVNPRCPECGGMMAPVKTLMGRGPTGRAVD